CVLGMVVSREWEIRKFVKTPFYRVIGSFGREQTEEEEAAFFESEWRVNEKSKYFESPKLYKENGFTEEKFAKELIKCLMAGEKKATVEKVEKKKEKKNPPLLFNLAELQNLSSKLFKISPDETLQIVQELYEKKLVTYPRTDARVLSSAVAKEITKNLKGLQGYEMALPYLRDIAERKSFLGLEKTRYVDDKKITDHYAIIPTGQGLGALASLKPVSAKMYEVIVRRFLCIFYPPAVYQKMNVSLMMDHPTEENMYRENFVTTAKVLVEEGFLPVSQYSFAKKKKEEENPENEEEEDSAALEKILPFLKKGMTIALHDMKIKEGETSPPKRYNSGSMILAMENAGQLIEDEELRALIKGSGIGTSATRAEILKKLVNIAYLDLNKKTQIITPTLKGELVCGIVRYSIPAMLSPKLTASWEKGLNGVSDGEISENEYMDKLTGFVKTQVGKVKQTNTIRQLQSYYQVARPYYENKKKGEKKNGSGNYE
ncbi:MAG: DNA topoisomerase, partial [Eubacterium sp.]